MIVVKQKGDFKHFENFSKKALRRDYLEILDEYCQRGVEALKAATPTDTGETADAWGYEIESDKKQTKVYFTNSHENNGVNVVILLIHGHATRGGTYVQGVDFVTPALQPVFEDISKGMHMELMKY